VLYLACAGYGSNLSGLLFVVHLGLNGHCIGVLSLFVSYVIAKRHTTMFVPSLLSKDPYCLSYVTRHFLIRLQATTRHRQLRLDLRCLCVLADQSNRSREGARSSTGRHLPPTLAFIHLTSRLSDMISYSLANYIPHNQTIHNLY
jgi:hypothetical protein